MERKMASVQKIDAINPIYLVDGEELAANIEQAIIGGWRLIVKRDEFKVDDLCVFFEVDSILPEAEWSEFLRSRKFKVGTLKLNRFADVNGLPLISQGLALPLEQVISANEWAVGDDITEVLGVTKYEAPIKFYQGNARGGFPTHLVPKTDETRIQSCMGVLDEMRGLPAYVTQKMDGSSATYFFDATEEKLRVCSRNLEKSYDENDLWWKVAIKYNLEEKLKAYPDIVIQGEVCGPSIQNNLLGLKDYELYVFNMFDIRSQQYASYLEFMPFCNKLGLNTVPIMEVIGEFDWNLDKIKEYTDGKLYPGTDKALEGIVVRPLFEKVSKVLGGRMSFKYINVQYSLKYGG